jgi:hypothetical protein
MHSPRPVRPHGEAAWLFAAGRLFDRGQQQVPAGFLRLADRLQRPLGKLLPAPERVTRFVSLGVPVRCACRAQLTALREIAATGNDCLALTAEDEGALCACGVCTSRHLSERNWAEGESTSGLTLTLRGLRPIPQTPREILMNLFPWLDDPPGAGGGRV